MKSSNQATLKLGTKSDAVRTKLISRTAKCESLAKRGQAEENDKGSVCSISFT